MDSPTDLVRALAYSGARIRLAELQQERDELETFLGESLSRSLRKPPARRRAIPIADRTPAAPTRPPAPRVDAIDDLAPGLQRPRRELTDAQRRRLSRALKARWKNPASRAKLLQKKQARRKAAPAA